MRVLITNDDGIEAPGLDVLEHIANQISKDVWVVAPETDQSGAAHSLTLAEPLRMRELSKRHYAVKGTPTDCVIMGVRFLLKDKPPDLVMSGVNRGQNLADDVNYSGTVAGAIEGVLLGVPSITQVEGLFQWASPGDVALLDADHGFLVINPSRAEMASIRAERKKGKHAPDVSDTNEAEADGVGSEDLIQKVFDNVPVP